MINKPRILILESIHECGIRKLEKIYDINAALGIKRDYLLKIVKEYDVIVIKGSVKVDEELIDCASRLKLVARAGTGTDNINIEKLSERGVDLITVPTGNTKSAAEFTIMQILYCCREMNNVYQQVLKRDYRRQILEGRELSQLNVGIIGVGNVGQEVAKRLKPFECRVMGWDPGDVNKALFSELGGVIVDELKVLLNKSDIVTLHARLNPNNIKMIDSDAIDAMKENVIIINSARAELVDDNAILEGISNGKISTYCTDVVNPEPDFECIENNSEYNHPFFANENIIYTPHIGASTKDAQKAISLSIADEIISRFKNLV